MVERLGGPIVFAFLVACTFLLLFGPLVYLWSRSSRRKQEKQLLQFEREEAEESENNQQFKQTTQSIQQEQQIQEELFRNQKSHKQSLLRKVSKPFAMFCCFENFCLCVFDCCVVLCCFVFVFIVISC